MKNQKFLILTGGRPMMENYHLPLFRLVLARGIVLVSVSHCLNSFFKFFFYILGQKFAMLEMKSTLSKVIRNYKLDAAKPYHNLVLAAETVLKSANGIKLSLKPRSN